MQTDRLGDILLWFWFKVGNSLLHQDFKHRENGGVAVNQPDVQYGIDVMVDCKFDGNLLPDRMFIRKMVESDWLDYGTWTIYTFPYRRSGPFIY